MAAPSKTTKDSDGRCQYQVQVHIIEARDLKGKGANGMSDPLCFVTINDEKQHTCIHKKTTSCTWDHLFFFDLKLKPEQFETQKMQVQVFDANTFKRNVLIGQYEFDLSFVYAEQKPYAHELHRRWVALCDTDNNEGIQGYLKCTVIVLGPGDQACAHDDEGDEDETEGKDLQSLVLMPPEMNLIPYELSIRCYRAENLPKMDRFGKCDGYVEAKFAGNPAIKTTVIKKSYAPVWNEELRLPVLTPTMSNLIEIALWDKDTAMSNDLISKFFLRFTDVQNDLFGPRWVNFYGAPEGSLRERVHQTFKHGKPEETAFVGRALFVVEAEHVEDTPMLGMKKISPCQEPPTDSFTMRFDLYEASELSSGKGLLENIVVELNIGAYSKKSKKASTKDGVTRWYQQFEEAMFSFPVDEEYAQVPDVILNVYAKNAVFGGARIGFIRLKAAEIMGFDSMPTWYPLTPDKLSPAYEDDEISGFVLFGLHLGRTKECTSVREPLQRPRLKSYELRAHIYQGRDLIPADSNGLSDPFIKVRLSTKFKKTTVKQATLSPMWYETLQYQIDLPQPLNLSPNVVVQCYDRDTLGSNDFLGRFEVPVTKIGKRFPGDPKWYSLYLDDPKNTKGQILASFQLIPSEEAADMALNDITPAFKNCLFEIQAVGLRNLLPYKMLPIQNPYIEFDCGERGDKTRVLRTKACNVPSGNNPNHMEVLRLPVRLPLNPLYSPAINVRVYDNKLMGVASPLIGSTSVPIGPYMPWTNLEKPKSADLPPVVDDVPGAVNTDDKKDGQILEEGLPDLETIPEDIEMANQIPMDLFAFISPARDGRAVGLGLRTLPEVADQDIDDNTEEKEEEATKRPSVKHELEHHFKELPFVEFQIMRGSSTNPLGFLARFIKRSEKETVTVVGMFKGNFKVLELEDQDGNKKSVPPPLDMQKVYAPQRYVVRCYILRGMQLVPKDASGKSDPYIVLSNGTAPANNIKDMDGYKKATLKPDFYKLYELPATLPGNSELTISVYDHDVGMSNELIGSTKIDLENRLFCDQWLKMSEKPTEYRTLWSPSSSNPQGILEMWIDILTEEQARVTPPTAISPPVPETYELRVIIWNTAEVVFKDKNMSDIFVSASMSQLKMQKTDVHWRSKNGKGAFNWRCVWPITLPCESPRLKIQVWDKDMLNANDAICEANLNLYQFLRKAYKQKTNKSIKKSWVVMSHPNFEGPQGKVEVSIEVMPESEAKSRPAGLGRSKPNDNPELPEPTRPKSSYAPWRMDKKFGNFLREKKLILGAVGGVGTIVGVMSYARFMGWV